MAFRRGVLSAEETRTILRATPAEVTSGLPPIVAALRQVESVRSEPAVGSPPSPVPGAAIAAVLRQASTPIGF